MTFEEMQLVIQGMLGMQGELQRSQQRMEANLQTWSQESNERLTRIEQLVESNNRFLESFSQDLRRYTENMDRISQQLAASTATANEARYESNTRLSAVSSRLNTVDSKLDDIDRKLGRGLALESDEQ